MRVAYACGAGFFEGDTGRGRYGISRHGEGGAMNGIDYYFWMNSDWAYLGADKLERIAAEHQVKIRYMPVDLPDVYRRTGGQLLGNRAPRTAGLSDRRTQALVLEARNRRESDAEIHVSQR